MQDNTTEGAITRSVTTHTRSQDVLVGNSKVTSKGKSIKDTKTFKASSVANTSNVEDKEITTMDEKNLILEWMGC